MRALRLAALAALASLASLGFAGCRSTTSTPAAAELRADAGADAAGARYVYLSLGDLQVHDDGAPSGPYLRGARVDAAFVPAAEAQVEGEVDEQAIDGEPGYLELSTLHFMRAQEARAPQRPYLEGRMTAQGFRPTRRAVQR